jgi:2',3'-cyclic-nucleotide 2'-phosphodiesterase
MNILCLGDVVGKPGRQAIEGLLEGLKSEFSLDCVVANSENAAGGSGLTPRVANYMFDMGCDVLTMGDHVWDQKELVNNLDEMDFVIRPANFPSVTPGKGWCIKELSSGIKIGVINLLGRVFMRYNVSCPFNALKEIVEEIRKETDIIIVDMHAEATSEKVAIGHFIDGQVSAVVGTHTHIQTADDRVLPNGTAYITDMGMNGPWDSVIGQRKEEIIERFLKSMPIKFQLAENDVKLQGVVVDIDENTGKARKITRIQRPYEGRK